MPCDADPAGRLGDTDWPQIKARYELLRADNNPVVARWQTTAGCQRYEHTCWNVPATFMPQLSCTWPLTASLSMIRSGATFDCKLDV